MADGPTPREEMDQLFDALVTFAQSMLEEHGEFYPVGAWIDEQGELGVVAADDGDERPDPRELIELLHKLMRERASSGTIRACAVCVDVRARRAEEAASTDAISVAIEHAAAEPVTVLQPYERRRLRGVRYGEPWAQEGERNVFA